MASTEMISISKEEFQALKSENLWLKHQLAELKQLIFGAKSERFITSDPDQSALFDLLEETSEKENAEQITYTSIKPLQEKKQP